MVAVKNAFKPQKICNFLVLNFLNFLERQRPVSSTSTLSFQAQSDLDQVSKKPEINFQEIEPTTAELNQTEKNLEPVTAELSNTEKSRTLTPGMDPNSMKAYSYEMDGNDRSKLSMKRTKSEGKRRSKVWTKSINSAVTGHLMSEQRHIFFQLQVDNLEKVIFVEHFIKKFGQIVLLLWRFFVQILR